MPDNHSQNCIYESLIGSIGNLHIVSESIKKDKVMLSSFADYINQNEAEITKFGKALMELRDYLGKYDFSKGFQLEAMNKKLEALHPLRLKLAKMGEEAKKLAVFPDRYGSKRAIEICRNLALTCMERMSLEESGKVSELVDANTGKLLDIQKKFASDDYIKDQINDAIAADRNTLVKYKAYYAEIQQYVSGFPHSGEDDLAVVKKRIETVKQVEMLVVKVGKTIEPIKSWCDRYNKSKVVANYMAVVNDAYTKMRYSDVDKHKGRLNDAEKQAMSVIAAFEKENSELVQLQSTLMRKSPEIWKEDNESMMGTITSLLGKDTRKASFSLEQLRNKIMDAKRNRLDYIGSMVKRFGWLTRKNYKGPHDDLISEYISLAEYNDSVEAMRKDHRKRVWKGVGLGVGIPVGIVVAIYAIYVIALFALGFVFLRFLLRSRDD